LCGLGAVLVVLAVLMVAPVRAEATPLESGALLQPTPLGCIGEVAEEVAKCATTVPYGLSFAYQVVVSPDNQSAYSVGVNGDLIEYSRDQANGELTAIGCFSSRTSAEPCASEHAEMEVGAVGDPSAIAITPDGKSVYVVSKLRNAIAEFEREPGGLLKKIGCITQEGSSTEGCTTGAKGLDVPYGVTVSPGGENVYVTGFGEEAVAEFKRDTESGVLTQLEPPNQCIGDASSPCETKTIGLKEDIGIGVSPEGRDVYVAAGAKGSQGDIATLARGPEGALEPLSGEERCISATFVPECKEGKYIEGIEDLAISPDGKNVYASSFDTNAVIELERTETGALEELPANNECVSTETHSGCSEAKAIQGAVGLAISPDGKDLYVTSQNEAAVAAFERNSATGALSQFATDPCVTEQTSGCGVGEFDKLIGLEYPRRLTVSPDGTNVYVAGQEAHAVAELRRSIAPAVVAITPNHGSEAGGVPVTIRGKGFAEGAEVYFNGIAAKGVTVNSASSITAVSPEGLSGVAKVDVTNRVGESVEVSSDLYSFTDLPVVSGVTPSVGKFAGGTEVAITGTEFTEGATVRFGGKPASSVKFVSSASLMATTPPGDGTTDVTVTTGKGTSTVTDNDHFDYISGGPKELGGVDLAGYCSNRGYAGDGGGATGLVRGAVEGVGYAYENWSCIETAGTEVLVPDAGPTLSEENICRSEYPGSTSYAYPENPNNAYSWNCYEAAGGETPINEESEEPKSGGGSVSSGEPTIKAASLVFPDVLVHPLVVPPVVAPVLAKTGNVAPVSGTVLVRVPGTSKFVPLSTLQQIPFGSVIEATHGTVSVTTAEPGGKTQTGEFFEGEFILRQGPNGVVIAELTGGNFAVCPTKQERSHIARASAASASGSHVVRKLWANAHGKFSTKGNYAAGAVQGTEWLTEDLCDGTYIKVTRDKVAVTNLVNHKHVEVTTGHHYLAKAP
jgi:DNA-binding beta-propeller fold protein YncE